MKELSDACFQDFLAVVHEATGVTIAKDRKVMLAGRLRKRLRALELDSFESYLDVVKSGGPEFQTFVDLVTTHETYFYRTPMVWNFLASHLEERDKSKPLKVWSAAASSGEEAYTIGIFCEEQRRKAPQFKYSVIASDVSEGVLSTAKSGIYSGRAIERFRNSQPDIFARHMQGNDSVGFRVGADIRSRIDFRAHNLMKPFRSAEKFEIIFLRNVLFYFNEGDQRLILASVAKSLQPGGYLIVGESESITRLDTEFQLHSPMIYSIDEAKEKDVA